MSWEVPIRVALSLVQEENVLIRKSVRQYQLDVVRPDSVRQELYDDEGRGNNVVEFSRTRESRGQPPDVNCSEILMQGNVSTDTLESVREPFIQRYRRTQQSDAYQKNKTSFELSI